ncbi:MAG TPA: LysR substrate-binding domain-containing protein [Noviherbaspirillum sp.]|nr:LysR substrate-binding domain-containing protein [Noviherbaspirillum sp.]
MKIRQLEAFRALVIGQTVTQAARMLYISQPAVTRLIADLEQDVGFALFERKRGRLYPTAEGLALYEEVERSFIGMERIQSTAAGIKASSVGMLQIAAAPALSLSFLPRAISAFIRNHPDVNFSLTSNTSRAVVDMVMKQRCSVGFVILPMNYPSMHGELLINTDLLAAMPAGHRLADKEVITPTDFDGERYVSNPRDLQSRLQADALFASFGVERKLQIETQINAGVCAFIEAGLGVALVDPVTALDYIGRGVVFRRFEPTLQTEFQVLYPSERPPSILVRAFVSHVRRFLQAELEERIYRRI